MNHIIIVQTGVDYYSLMGYCCVFLQPSDKGTSLLLILYLYVYTVVYTHLYCSIFSCIHIFYTPSFWEGYISLVRQGLFLFDRTATISMNRKLLIHRKGKKSLFDGEKCLTSDELKPVTFPKTLPSAECPAQPKIEELCLKFFIGPSQSLLRHLMWWNII